MHEHVQQWHLTSALTTLCWESLCVKSIKQNRTTHKRQLHFTAHIQKESTSSPSTLNGATGSGCTLKLQWLVIVMYGSLSMFGQAQNQLEPWDTLTSSTIWLTEAHCKLRVMRYQFALWKRLTWHGKCGGHLHGDCNNIATVCCGHTLGCIKSNFKGSQDRILG